MVHVATSKQCLWKVRHDDICGPKILGCYTDEEVTIIAS